MSTEKCHTIDLPLHGVRVSHLGELVREWGGRDALRGKTISKVNKEIIQPLTNEKQCSFCDIISDSSHPQNEAYGDKANVYITVTWNYKFLDMVDALVDHFKNDPNTVIWLSLFSKYDVFEWSDNVYKSVIEEIHHTVMVMSPWNDPTPFTRAWCIYEAYCSVESHCKFEIALSAKDKMQFLTETVGNVSGNVSNIVKKMQTMFDTRNCESLNFDDQSKIHSVIEGTVGFADLNTKLFEQFRDCLITMAKDHYEELLQEDSEKQDHATLTAMSNLAALYHEQGEYDLAQGMHEECLERRKIVLGDTHPDTLTSMHCLAEFYAAEGKFNLAKPLYEECLRLRKKVLKKNDPSTLSTMHSLAGIHHAQGELETAKAMYKECWELRKKVLRLNSPATLSSMHSLAGIYHYQENFKKAKSLYEKCLRQRKAELGDAHTDTLITMNNLALLYHAHREYDLAKPLFLKCYNIRKATLGDSHPSTLRSLDNLKRVISIQVSIAKND